MSRVQRGSVAAVFALIMSASLGLADATVEQKTNVKFGGMIGGVINVFGGKAAREGLTSTVYVKGNRKLTNSGSSGEIVDLSEEKIYQLDYDRKTYKVVTFAELRRQMEEARKNAEKSAKESAKESGSSKQEGPEMEVDFDVKETGKKETISGFNTKQVIVTISVREKGKKIEQSGGWVLTSDMWMGPKVPAMREIAEFETRYLQKLYGGTGVGTAMQQMAMLMATTPAFGKAMKVFSEKQSSLDGTPIRSTMTFETVMPPGQTASEDRSSSQPTSLGAAAIGGLMGRMKARQQAKEGSSSQAAAPAANRSRLFESTTEVLKASSAAAAANVALPAEFKQRR